MGRGIAQVAAQAGLDVVMSDATKELAEKGLARVAADLAKLVEKGKMAADERDAVLARIRPVGETVALAQADFVVEAATERTEIKLDVFRMLDAS